MLLWDGAAGANYWASNLDVPVLMASSLDGIMAHMVGAPHLRVAMLEPSFDVPSLEPPFFFVGFRRSF